MCRICTGIICRVDVQMYISASGMTRRDEEAISGDPVIKAQIVGSSLYSVYIYLTTERPLSCKIHVEGSKAGQKRPNYSWHKEIKSSNIHEKGIVERGRVQPETEWSPNLSLDYLNRNFMFIFFAP